jgi:hypothetical protein
MGLAKQQKEGTKETEQNSTTIKLSKSTVQQIKELKLYPSEPYEGTILRALEALKEKEQKE